MNRIHFLFLVAACALGYAAYNHAGSVEASIADAAVEAAARKVGLTDEDCKDIGNAGRKGAQFVNAGLNAVNGPVSSANDAAIHDELRGEIDALKSRVGVLERRKECTCQPVVAAPAAPVVPEVSYEGGCANGQCGIGFGGRFFGRRR